ncbi:MAG TPA: ATP synthase F0 subunit C [Bryobacteraceae bacterium]|nr:ATP synthase F0 subunit C [Bryobacteraceae bacterium]HOQ46331.1 ATP synthase F0 subunit C [Bryobacteraceae bacterium]HPU72232.1 ATP synthase F0 subunit C [Bryobacteraceae bacterium]
MKTKLLVLMAAMFLLATPMFAQAEGAAAAPAVHWVWITSGFAMAIASAVCGLAQGLAVGKACEGMARNPGAAASIRFALIFGLVLIESLALYTLVIIFIKVAA